MKQIYFVAGLDFETVYFNSYSEAREYWLKTTDKTAYISSYFA